MMKKILSLFVCIAFLITLSYGCDNTPTSTETSSSAESKTESASQPEFENMNLEVAIMEAGYGKTYWEAIIEVFSDAYPGVVVKLTSSPKIDDVLKPLFMSGNPPDFICHGVAPKTYAAEGALAVLNDVFDGNALDQDVPLKDLIFEGFLDICSPLGDGKIYYAPSAMASQGLFYNKTYFEENNLTPPKTIDEFLALGEYAKEHGTSLYTYQGIYPDYNGLFLMPLIASSAGMDAFRKIINYEEGAWTDPNVKKALKVFYDIAQNDYLMEGTTALNHTQAQTEFLNGKALFIPNGTWFENEMADAIPESGFSFGFMAPPVFSEGDTSYAETGHDVFYIPAQAKNIELAKEFLRYQYIEESIILNAQKTTSVAPVKGAIELCKPYISEAMYECFRVYSDGTVPLTTSWKVTTTTSVSLPTVLFDALTSVSNKQLTVDEWVGRIEEAAATIRAETAS